MLRYYAIRAYKFALEVSAQHYNQNYSECYAFQARSAPLVGTRFDRTRCGGSEAFLSNGTCNVEHIFYNQISPELPTIKLI